MTPGSPELYSDQNVANSLSLALAARLLAAGYVLYWHTTDALQTPDGWYPGYSARRDLVLADAQVAARLAAARGLLTIRGKLPANPVYVTRLPDDSRVGGADEVNVPALSLAVGPAISLAHYELGSKRKWRVRRLTVVGCARDEVEQSRLVDLVGLAFDDGETADVLDHENAPEGAVPAPVGPVTLTRPQPTTSTRVGGAEATTYTVAFNARIEYVA